MTRRLVISNLSNHMNEDYIIKQEGKHLAPEYAERLTQKRNDAARFA